MKESKIKRAIDNIDDELICEAMNEKSLNPAKTPWAKLAAIAAAVLVVAGCMTVLLQNHNSDSNYTPMDSTGIIVALDVNPSIELEINDAGKIEEVKAFNDDARVMLGDMELRDKDMREAVNALVDAMLKTGYLTVDKNSILISVDAENSDRSAELQNTLKNSVSALLKNSNIDASVITQEFKKSEYKDEDISAAKSSLIKKIISAGLSHKDGTAYTYEQLKPLNVNELKLILESKKLQVEGTTTLGTAGKGEFITAEYAESLAISVSGIDISEVLGLETELDFDDTHGVMIYEIEFRAGVLEYEYEINAKSGDVLKEETEPYEPDENDDIIQIPADAIAEAEAIFKALIHAGFEADDVTDVECEAELLGEMFIYEISFDAGNKEYEYKINGLSGEIIEFEIEPNN